MVIKYNKKTLIVGIIILLFFGASLTVQAQQNTKNIQNTILNGNILYVGGSGPGNYTEIQDAIDDASDGDTVFVYSGIYEVEPLSILNKSINLIGENKETTTIVSTDSVIYRDNPAISLLNVEYSTISGFSIDSTTSSIGVYKSKNVVISNNILDDSGSTGVYVEDIFNDITLNENKTITIKDNLIYGGRCGIHINNNIELFYHINVHIEIQNNTIDGASSYAIICENSKRRILNFIISDNTIRNCESGTGGGIILLHKTPKAIISNNNIINNNGYPINAEDSRGLFVWRNNIYNNSEDVRFYIHIKDLIFDYLPVYGTIWSDNYWGESLNVKIIKGGWYIGLFKIPILHMDKNPAQVPYDI